ncbi:MAG: hypothetical protein MZV70_00950 [Desulfobacterales bacterium]|nr:hypothetical protein [Desulfobacterales bacterium]
MTVVETYEVGGTCLELGMHPDEVLVSSAEAFHTVKRAGDFGIDLSWATAAPNADERSWNEKAKSSRR